MSKGVNEMAATGIESAVRALEATLLMIITAIQEIVVFIIGLITNTYVCLITLAVKGSVGVLVDATKEITDFINKATTEIFDEAQSGLKGLQDGLDKFSDGLGTVSDFFGGGPELPKIELPAIDKLKDIKIPDTFTQKLDDLEKSIPDFHTVKDAANKVIRMPFQEIHEAVNKSLGVYSFDRSIFPVPEKEELTFCSDNPAINNFFDGLEGLVQKVKMILVGVLAALAILAMFPMGYLEYRRYRKSSRYAYAFSDPDKEIDPADVVYISSRPSSATVGLRLADRFGGARRKNLVRWAVAYVTSPPALFVLSLGLAGLAGVLCQYIMLKQVEEKAPELAAEMGAFAGIVVEKLGAASTAWGVQTNEAITTTNKEINDELFGWVHKGTDSLNDTLTTFVDEMMKGVDSFFGETPFAEPIKDVLDCLIVFKVQGIQKGLTWAHENAKITFPNIPPDTFSLGAIASISPEASGSESFLANPDSVASDQITDVLLKLTGKWEQMLTQEGIISACVTAVWFIVLGIAIVRTLCMFWGHDRTRGEGGNIRPPSYTGEGRAAVFAHPNAQRQGTFTNAFAPSPSDAYPPSHDEDAFVVNEKEQQLQVGSVKSGNTALEESSNRYSVHPKFGGR
jgi:hypothetical protein